MSANSVIPTPAERRRGAVVTEVGRVQDMAGLPLVVAVNGGAVLVSGHALNGAQRETFAQLLVRACWLAGGDEPP